MREEARESFLLHGGDSVFSAGNPATRRAMRLGPEALRHCLTAVLPLGAGHTLPACNCELLRRQRLRSSSYAL
jgi:hypothetical protein